MSRLQFAVFVGLASIFALCGCAPRAPGPPAPAADPVGARLREVFALIESGNAHKLYPVIMQDERDKENLTEAQLNALLRVTVRCLKGTTPVPLVLNGADYSLVGIFYYRIGGNVVLQVAVNSQKSPDGTIRSPSFIWNLVMETADAIGNPGGKALPSPLEHKRATVRGLSKLRDELKSDGPQLILGPSGALTFDEVISNQEDKVRTLEAKNATSH